MSEQPPVVTEQDKAPEPDKGAMRWSAVMVLGVVAVLLSIVVLELLVIQEVVPPLVAIVVLMFVGLFLLRGGGRPGVILLGIVGLAYLVLVAPFAGESFAFPASTLDFVVNLVSIVGCLALMIGAVAILRVGSTEAKSSRARTVAVVLFGIVALGAVVSVVARLTREDPLAKLADVTITAQDTEFSPREITATAAAAAPGGDLPVSFFIQNEDLTAHTFTIDELGIDEAIPGGGSARAEVEDAAPGTYEYYCRVTGHEDMKGTVILETEF